MPVFTFPLAFLALLAVPALVAIYWLRNRAKERRVSSLLLWLDEKQRWDGGQRIHRLQMPLLFFLELAAILLLVMAAAKPLLRAGDAARPLVIVLDDSFSMLAGGGDSTRNRAAKAIESELRANRYEPVRFVLAGETPQLLGEATGNTEQAIKLLPDWNCGAPAAKLEEAVAFAFELGGNRARVLVATDHAPVQEISDSRLQWWSFGSALPNLAFINATRTARDREERVMLEVANLSPQTATANLTIETGGANNPQALKLGTLGAKETRRIALTVKNGAVPLHAKLGEDALQIDNEVVLMPEASRSIRVDLRVRDARLRELIEKAVQSSPQAKLNPENPELVITDEADSNVADAESWTLRVLNEKDASSYLGPFVIDRVHPLAEGLSLGGVVWGAGKSQLAGMPVITAGNLALLTDLDRAGKHELRLRLRPEASTLQETPNWPILISNLIVWRASVAPGLRGANVRLGGEANLIVEPGVQSISLVDPQRNARQLVVRDKAVTITADSAGVYELSANQTKYAFAANAISREESDLTEAASGRWGNWANAPSLEWEYRSFVWLLLLFVLIVLAVHGWLVARQTAR
ncbi:MAG: BatA and WFA domain-containing protein [Acidobacteriota bacterium]